MTLTWVLISTGNNISYKLALCTLLPSLMCTSLVNAASETATYAICRAVKYISLIISAYKKQSALFCILRILILRPHKMAVVWNATKKLCIFVYFEDLVNLLIKCWGFFLRTKCCNNLSGPVSISEASACAADWAAHCHGFDWLNPARTQTTAMGCKNYLIWVEIYLGLKHPDISSSKVPAVFVWEPWGNYFFATSVESWWKGSSASDRKKTISVLSFSGFIRWNFQSLVICFNNKIILLCMYFLYFLCCLCSLVEVK